jgi:hypothetical protein
MPIHTTFVCIPFVPLFAEARPYLPCVLCFQVDSTSEWWAHVNQHELREKLARMKVTYVLTTVNMGLEDQSLCQELDGWDASVRPMLQLRGTTKEEPEILVFDSKGYRISFKGSKYNYTPACARIEA